MLPVQHPATRSPRVTSPENSFAAPHSHQPRPSRSQSEASLQGTRRQLCEGARSANHHVSRIDIAALDFPFLRTMEEFQNGKVPTSLEEAAHAIRDADHIVFIFPLWLVTMPALLKAFLEQLMRPGIAFAYPEAGKTGSAKTLLKGRSARVVVTMGMPPFSTGFGISAMVSPACAAISSILSASVRCGKRCSAC
jgi:FMN-dependent NADH-azoreductase